MTKRTKLTIDPITRIEGHLKIEVEITDNQVTDAWSSGTLFRGIEIILKDRDPKEAWLFTQRLCGVCTYVHGVSSVRCVEDSASVKITDNARLIRNLLMGAQYLHDHPIHFYHLNALDFVDIVSALSADAAATEALAAQISPDAVKIDFQETKTRLEAFVNGGQLGIFADGYWGHSVYKLTPEENLLFAAHYLYALRKQVQAAKMQAIFGAKNPHIQSLRVGGVTCDYELTSDNISAFSTLLGEMMDFTDTIYLPDVLYLAKKYPDWATIGGFSNYLSYGEFQTENSGLFLPGGAILNQDIHNVQHVDLSKISEHVYHSFFSGAPLHPSIGKTEPNYTGFDGNNEYSWLKAPRYNGEPMEVGPLARVLIAYAQGHNEIKALVDNVLNELGVGVEALHSTIGRVAARAIETKVIGDEMSNWLSDLTVGGSLFVSPTIPDTATGFALNEAPRGALGHWINISNQKIENYQMVVPSTWNLGPRCDNHKRGPVEEALIGTPVADPAKPVEILRVIHSYDPCLACAAHIIDKTNNKNYIVKITE